MYDEERITTGTRVARQISRSVHSNLTDLVRAKCWSAPVEFNIEVSYPASIMDQGLWWIPDWRDTGNILVSVKLRTLQSAGKLMEHRLEVGAHYTTLNKQEAYKLARDLYRSTGIEVSYEIWGTSNHFRVNRS